jgi:hypothetical protein
MLNEVGGDEEPIAYLPAPGFEVGRIQFKFGVDAILPLMQGGGCAEKTAVYCLDSIILMYFFLHVDSLLPT